MVGQTINLMLGVAEGMEELWGVGEGERGAEGWEIILMATLKQNESRN